MSEAAHIRSGGTGRADRQRIFFSLFDGELRDFDFNRFELNRDLLAGQFVSRYAANLLCGNRRWGLEDFSAKIFKCGLDCGVAGERYTSCRYAAVGIIRIRNESKGNLRKVRLFCLLKKTRQAGGRPRDQDEKAGSHGIE